MSDRRTFLHDGSGCPPQTRTVSVNAYLINYYAVDFDRFPATNG